MMNRLTSEGQYWICWWGIILGFIFLLSAMRSCTAITIAEIENEKAPVEVRK